MNVMVAGDGIVVTADKHWEGLGIREGLQQYLLLPEQYVHKLLTEKRVLMGSIVAATNSVLSHRQKIRLVGDVEEDLGVQLPEESSLERIDPLYEDDHLMVVNKPAGYIIYPADPSDTSEPVTLAHLVAQYYLETGQVRKVRHVHRLDKETTGTILYAKHGYSARAFDALLLERKIGRKYVAIVRGKPQESKGTISLPIGRDRHTSGRYRVSQTGKPAVTHYQVMGTAKIANGAVSLVECRLETGRTHQIRVHLSALGCPIVGDTLYGGGTGIGPYRMTSGQALHAAEVSFYHPYTQSDIRVEAPLPDAFRDLLTEVELPLL